MREFYDVDISSHKPRNIADVQMDQFDRIIVLDPYVFEFIKSRYRWAVEILISWDIDDPYGQNKDAYKNTASLLHRYFKKFLK